MNSDTSPVTDNSLTQELQQLRDYSVMLYLLGGGLVVVGILAIVFSCIATLATVTILGSLLFVGGVIQVVNAVSCRCWRGFFVYLVVAILSCVVGVIMMNHPLAAAAGLTLLLAATFIVGGAIRVVVAPIERFYGWPLVMANGFINFFLGIYIWRHLPETAFWVIGLFVGIDLIFNGWSWIMLAWGIRGVAPKKAA